MEYSSADIAAIVQKIIAGMGAEETAAGNGADVPIGVSNRHVHLSREHLDVLFGKGYELTKAKDLSQPGQYAANEVVTIVGPSLRPIEKVRVLGPIRSASELKYDNMKSKVEGKGKKTRWYGVQVRVNKAFALEMHVDTDDANAAGIGNGSLVKIVKE